MINKLKLNEIFDNVISSCYVGFKKPNNKMFDKIIEVTKLKPKKIVFCDDKEEHVNVLTEFGFTLHRYHSIEEFKSILYREI